jgi:hypothetical protein
MSHWTTIKTQVRDLAALEDAAKALGLELKRGEDVYARGYGGQRIQGDAVIVCNFIYDIAVQKQSDGTYGLVTDWWGGHVEKEVGKEYGRLLQRYGVAVATRQARARGYRVQERTLADGSVKLMIGGM